KHTHRRCRRQYRYPKSLFVEWPASFAPRQILSSRPAGKGESSTNTSLAYAAILVRMVEPRPTACPVPPSNVVLHGTAAARISKISAETPWRPVSMRARMFPPYLLIDRGRSRRGSRDLPRFLGRQSPTCGPGCMGNRCVDGSIALPIGYLPAIIATAVVRRAGDHLTSGRRRARPVSGGTNHKVSATAAVHPDTISVVSPSSAKDAGRATALVRHPCLPASVDAAKVPPAVIRGAGNMPPPLRGGAALCPQARA